jgi:hypothetical protein
MLQAVIGYSAIDGRQQVRLLAENPLQLGTHGGKGDDREGDDQGNNITLMADRGNDPDYLTARIARDFSSILDRMKAGEFRSVLAAITGSGVGAGELSQIANIPLELS